MKKNKWFRKNGIILLLTVAFLISAVWTYVTYIPPAEDAPQEEAVTFSFQPEYEIRSRKDTSIWPKGTSLAQGRAAYFYAGAPVVKVTPTVSIRDSGSIQIAGTLETRITLQAVSETGTIYWDYPLNSKPDVQNFTLTRGFNGQTDQVIFTADEITLDIQAAYEKILEINDEINHHNAVYQLNVMSDIQCTGTVNNRQISTGLANTLSVNLKTESFTIPTTQDSSSDILLNSEFLHTKVAESTLTKVIHQNSTSFSIDAFLLLLLLISIVAKKAKPAFAKGENRRFKEWITEGSVNTQYAVSIGVYTLEGLVDLAIDLDKRVIHDLDKKKYYVLDDNLAYVYNPDKGKDPITGEKKVLGKLLLERGVLLPEQLEIGLLHHRKFDRKLGESLIELGFIDEITLYSAIAAQNHTTYVELDLSNTKVDDRWLAYMTLNQARALEVIPLGVQEDGKLVIACVNPYSSGTRDALKELFHTEIAAVATRPSVLYQMIEQLYCGEQVYHDTPTSDTPEHVNFSHRLSQDEYQKFIDNYKQGFFMPELYLKASGFVGQTAIARAPEKEILLQWLSSNHYLNSIDAQLLTGIRLAISGMDSGKRQKLQVPELDTVLIRSNFITLENSEWIRKEVKRKALPYEQVLAESYLATADLIEKTTWLLRILGELLHPSE